MVLALALRDHRCKQDKPAVLRQGEYLVHHLLYGLCLQGLSMLRTFGCACTGKKQPQVVVYLGDGGNGGTRIVAGGFLFDGDGG